MTCIVGIVGKKGVLLAGDSQWSGYNSRHLDTESKVFKFSPIMALGCCGSGRTGQVLQHLVSDGMDDPSPNEDLRRWYVREFQPRMAAVLESYGSLYRYREDSVEELGDSAYLLAVRDRLFMIQSDFALMESVRPFMGLASGGETATGALYAAFETWQVPDGPVGKPWKWMEDAAAVAIEAASESTTGVGGTVRYVRTDIYTPDEKSNARIILKDGPTPRFDEGWYE